MLNDLTGPAVITQNRQEAMEFDHKKRGKAWAALGEVKDQILKLPGGQELFDDLRRLFDRVAWLDHERETLKSVDRIIRASMLKAVNSSCYGEAAEYQVAWMIVLWLLRQENRLHEEFDMELDDVASWMKGEHFMDVEHRFVQGTQEGPLVRVNVPGNPYDGRLGRIVRCSKDGKFSVHMIDAEDETDDVYVTSDQVTPCHEDILKEGR